VGWFSTNLKIKKVLKNEIKKTLTNITYIINLASAILTYNIN